MKHQERFLDFLSWGLLQEGAQQKTDSQLFFDFRIKPKAASSMAEVGDLRRNKSGRISCLKERRQ
jgi:hypothetical protein